jgi:hypothetical protein
MSLAAKARANAGRDAGWSRRRALQSAGAALASGVGIAEHTPDALAQSPAGSPAVPATPTIPADFKVVLHAAEVQNWPYVLPITIPTFAQTSLGGVVALVLAQHEGFAYVKP